MSLTDAIDHEIVMHRDAHFAGSFEEMLSYYQNEENIGVQPEFELDRIGFLAESEKRLNTNLSSYLLYDDEREKVELAKEAYRNLRKIYEVDQEKNPLPHLIADLILSEREDPQEEIRKIACYQKEATSELLKILQWEEGYDPLFPGYGYAPYFALKAFSEIKDERVIPQLFELLNRETVFGEQEILTALLAQGKEAERFLLTLLKSRPLSRDNVNAAFALSVFPNNSDVEAAAALQLEMQEVWKDPSLFSYLLFLCSEKQLDKLLQNSLLPENLKKEIEESRKR